jgi:hypothetical protein
MSDVNELILALAKDDMVKANSVFGDVMGNKINDALDDAKIQMAQSMLGIDNEDDESDEDYDESEDNEVEEDSGYNDDDEL